MEGMQVEEKSLNKNVELNLPKDWHLRVFKVVSYASGETYWVQWMRRQPLTNFRAGVTWGAPIDGIPLNYHHVVLCDCPNGKFRAPLSICAPNPKEQRVPESECKHIEYVRATINWE